MTQNSASSALSFCVSLEVHPALFHLHGDRCELGADAGAGNALSRSEFEAGAVMAADQQAFITEKKLVRRPVERTALVGANIPPGGQFAVAVKQHQPLWTVAGVESHFLAFGTDFVEAANRGGVAFWIHSSLSRAVGGPSYWG